MVAAIKDRVSNAFGLFFNLSVMYLANMSGLGLILLACLFVLALAIFS